MKKTLQRPKKKQAKAAPQTALGRSVREKQEKLRRVRRGIRFLNGLAAVLGVAIPLVRLGLTVRGYLKLKEKAEARKAPENAKEDVL